MQLWHWNKLFLVVENITEWDIETIQQMTHHSNRNGRSHFLLAKDKENAKLLILAANRMLIQEELLSWHGVTLMGYNESQLERITTSINSLSQIASLIKS